VLSVTDRYNECDDRIKDDLGRFRIEAEFGRTYSDYLHKQAQNLYDVFYREWSLKPTKKRKVSDGWYSEIYLS
jgi:hypothetical protein